MTFIARPIDSDPNLPFDGESDRDSTRGASPFWKITLLVVINYVSVLFAIPLFYFSSTFPPALAEPYWYFLVGIYHGQLFLLAYWMAFGGTPQWGRRTLATALAMAGAAPVAVMVAHRALIYFKQDFTLRTEDFGPILIALTIIWSLHAVFRLANAFARIVITFNELRSTTQIHHSRVTIANAWHGVLILAAPFGFAILLNLVDHELVRKMAVHVVISTLFSAIALSPAALLLVTDAHFGWKCVGSACWAILVLIGFLLVDAQWSPEDTAMAHAVTCVVVFANLLLLRALGLRWLPLETSPQSVVP